MFESSGNPSIMSQTLGKRGRESDAALDSIDIPESKRFDGEETDLGLHLLQLDKTLADDEEECTPSEELLHGVMRTLEDLIAATCSTSSLSNSANNLEVFDISDGHEGQIVSDVVFDLCYLLQASDDELGLPPSPVVGFKDELCLSSTETSEGLWENLDLVAIGENWHFQDDFENNLWFASYENACDASQLQEYMNTRGFVSQGLLFEEDPSEVSRLENSSCM